MRENNYDVVVYFQVTYWKIPAGSINIHFIGQNSKVASREHIEQIPSTKLTIVQETFVMVTFVHMRNISAVTDPILMKP